MKKRLLMSAAFCISMGFVMSAHADTASLANVCVPIPADLLEQAKADADKQNKLQDNLLRYGCMTAQWVKPMRDAFAAIDQQRAANQRMALLAETQRLNAEAERATRQRQAEAVAQEQLARTAAMQAQTKATLEQMEIAKQAAQARADAENAAAQEEQQKRQIAQAEQTRLAAIEAAKPINRLAEAYKEYVLIQTCYKDRNGYVAVWINDVEMERAHRAVADIEKKLTTEDPSIDKDKLWNSTLGTVVVSPNSCHLALQDLMDAWGQTGNSDFSARKDF